MVLDSSDRELGEQSSRLRRRTASQALVYLQDRADVCEGRPEAQVAGDLGVSRETVRKGRARFVADRLDGQVDKPRTDAPRRSRTSRSNPWSPIPSAGSHRAVIRTGRRFTPASASWLNLVEGWFTEVTCRRLRRAPTAASSNRNAASAAGSTSGASHALPVPP
ncbi:hypothetical protein LK07_03795 [Streptomyces pluripotens]|uniref:Uncharacterized protein n=1 Tax=Streptomyces pluripotens TaxID=1355015 RepID=A0A221NTY0_9ACTN|nr:hypothetical protein LK06_002710 [Streptomyces pluripotens]ASN23296.1 hypothetical protein LK07_03795 [Streptomyces pluripotens]